MRSKHFYADASIPELYRWFAKETATASPVWEQVSRWVAQTNEVIVLLDGLPGMKRQPNLYLAALRFLGAPLEPGPVLRDWTLQHWEALRDVILTHATQTNEPGRCATLLPLLTQLPGPLALLEVGSSAGLCLYPDRYRYRYTDGATSLDIGDDPSAPLLECHVRSGPLPEPQVPDVIARIGVDLNPLDPRDDDTARWLQSLIWPGQPERERRLRAAISVAATDPATVITGDLIDSLDAALAAVPTGSTPVVFHSAVLAYLDRTRRQEFVDRIRHSGAHWIANEGLRVVPGVGDQVPSGVDPAASFILSTNGRPVARTAPHGQWIEWF